MLAACVLSVRSRCMRRTTPPPTTKELLMARTMVRFNPLAELDALQQQLLGDDFFTQFRGVTMPTTDVYMQDDSHMTVEAHLPNFDENDINISVDDGVLIVQAE